MVCSGCGAAVGYDEPYPFRCPNADAQPSVDHVLVRELGRSSVAFPDADADAVPATFVRGVRPDDCQGVVHTELHSHRQPELNPDHVRWLGRLPHG
jgi:hypothetical protein